MRFDMYTHTTRDALLLMAAANGNNGTPVVAVHRRAGFLALWLYAHVSLSTEDPTEEVFATMVNIQRCSKKGAGGSCMR
jgi:hypothetical protein